MLISSSDNNLSYQYQLLAQSDAEALNDPDYEWIHYLQDHRELMRENSTVIAINETNMTLYRYRPRKFLDNVGAKEELEVAFRVVNRIGSDMEFSEYYYDSVYVPNYEYVYDLRRMYVTLKYQEEDL